MLRAMVLTALCIAASAVSALGCDAPADELSGGRSRVGGSRISSADGADDDDDTTGASSSGAPGSTSSASAKALFQTLQPKLSQNCGPCHTLGANASPVWLDPADPHASIASYKGIIVADPATSILLTKAAHEGPALPSDMTADVKAWLTAEATTISTTAPPTNASTTAIAIPNGAASVDLPAPGGRITFTASMASGILTLKTVTLAAPTSGGVHATGVHIEIAHADGTATLNDSLSDADSTAAAGATAPIGVGLVVIPRIAGTDKIAFHIDTLVPSTGGGTQTVGGCKSVASFQTNAAPLLKANCMNCHNTGGTGFGALDLSALNAATPDFAKACGQAKSRIDTATPANSQLITAPTGGVANHPYKNAPANYKTQITTWITAEK